jgi:hypothetical protein
MEIALKETQQPLVMIGDFNTGRNDLDVEGSGTRFDCADQFIGLSAQAACQSVGEPPREPDLPPCKRNGQN